MGIFRQLPTSHNVIPNRLRIVSMDDSENQPNKQSERSYKKHDENVP